MHGVVIIVQRWSNPGCRDIGRAGEPLLHEALGAIRAHREAQEAGAPAEVVERLKLLADFLYLAVVDFQLLEADRLPGSVH